MRLQAVTLGLLVIAMGSLALLVFLSADRPGPDAAAAREAALRWTDAELADGPRRVGNGWEVDVRRADGSLVEVALDDSLQLLEFDEELGPRGTPAHDQVVGAARERAIAAARPASGPGPVRSVEREDDGTIEVDVVASGRTVLEVELDRRLRVRDVDEEDIGDE